MGVGEGWVGVDGLGGVEGGGGFVADESGGDISAGDFGVRLAQQGGDFVGRVGGQNPARTREDEPLIFAVAGRVRKRRDNAGEGGGSHWRNYRTAAGEEGNSAAKKLYFFEAGVDFCLSDTDDKFSFPLKIRNLYV